MLFFLSILLIVIGVSGALLLNVIAWQIAATVACMIGVALLIIYYEQKYSALREKNDELRQKLDRQQKGFDRQLSQKDEEISRQRHKLEKSTSIPSIHSDLPILQRVAILRSYFVEENSDIDYRRLFDEIEIAIKNQKLLVQINKNLTVPLLEQLKETRLPLEDGKTQELLGKLMQQAFVSIDFMQEFRSTLDGDDSLALRVAAGLMSSKEAAAQARRANAIVSETEKPLRVILALLEKLNLTDINLIVKDTVF